MSRALDSTLLDALAAPATRPGYFIEYLFSTPVRHCTRGTIEWNGNEWVAWDVRVSGIDVNGAQASQRGTLSIRDPDFAFSTLVLDEGISERPINIWKFYGDLPELGDAVQIFSGVGDSASIDAANARTELALAFAGGRTLSSPRRYITRDQGFSQLPAPGTIINWGGENFALRGEG